MYIKKVVFIFLYIFIVSEAVADKYCTGMVKAIWTDAYGNMYAKGSWRDDHAQICNVNGGWNGVDEKTCSAWLSSLLMAKSMENTVTLRYPNSIGSCAQIPAYTASPKPDYVMLND